MTTTTTDAPHLEFVRLLPTNAQRSLTLTQAVVALVHGACTNHGWTPKLLAQECGRDLGDVANAGAVVTARLRKAAAHPPPNAPAKRPSRPLCGECEDGWVVDPKTRRPVAKCACRTTNPTTSAKGHQP